jgi:dihydrofolate synthase/folylpolyglutamate synthase
METVQESPLVILDGAHNPEKISALIDNVLALYPERRIVLVYGALESKSFREMFDLLVPHARALIATSPRVLAKPAIEAADIAALASDDLPVEAVRDPVEAVDRALELAQPDDLVLVTGSLYLVGNVRERWYPTVRILSEGTLWPSG